MEKDTSQKLLLAWLLCPPLLYLLYMAVLISNSFNGHCGGVLEAGPECDFIAYFFTEITSTFVLPQLALVTLYWFGFAGMVHLANVLRKKLKKNSTNTT